MAIFRGEGGSGESVTNTLVSQVAANAVTASTKADEAAASAVSASNSADAAAVSAAGVEAFATAAEAAQTAAELAQTNAETAETNAEAAEALAEKWATELEDVVVADSKYSAFHWAQKAEEFAAGASAVTSVDLTAGTGISVSGGPITTSGSITVNVTFGTTSGTAAEGNDSRINNGQTAFGWGDHSVEGYLTTVAFADITSKPTTLSGYGITDGASTGKAIAMAIVFG